MKLIVLVLMTLFVLSCKKHEDTPPPYTPIGFDGNVIVERDTFDRYVIYPNNLVAGDTTETFIAAIALQRSTPHPADTNWLGKPIFERYARPGYLAVRYVGEDSLFQAGNAKTLDGYIDYTLPQNLAGKLLFHCFSLYDGYSGDTVSHTYLYAGSQTTHILIQSDSTTPKATTTSIAASYNALMKRQNKLDSPWFHIEHPTY
ncbi:MAG TPA: hypothetical protein VGN00_07005 [Puia sp.]